MFKLQVIVLKQLCSVEAIALVIVEDRIKKQNQGAQPPPTGI